MASLIISRAEFQLVNETSWIGSGLEVKPGRGFTVLDLESLRAVERMEQRHRQADRGPLRRLYLIQLADRQADRQP